uniref:F-box domain-containing protein n=2 Tax=Bursaphelenchus xylophilus TaxID=6326 RepID=A0A1I7RMK3_BURXY
MERRRLRSHPQQQSRRNRRPARRNSSLDHFPISEPTPSTPIPNFPNETIGHLMLYLDAQSLRACSEVSRLWRQLSESERVWRAKSEEEGCDWYELSKLVRQFRPLSFYDNKLTRRTYRLPMYAGFPSAPLAYPLQSYGCVHDRAILKCAYMAKMRTVGNWVKRRPRSVNTLDCPQSDYLVDWDEHGRVMAFVGSDHRITIFSMLKSEVEVTFYFHQSQVVNICVAGDAKMIMSADREANVVFWNVHNGLQFAQIKSTHGQADALKLWCDEEGEKYLGILFNSDTRYVTLWNPLTKQQAHTRLPQVVEIANNNRNPDEEHDDEVEFDGQRAIISTGNSVFVLSVDNNKVLVTHVLSFHQKNIFAMVYCPQRKLLVTSDDNNIVCVWNINTGRLDRHLAPHGPGMVLTIALNKKGDILATSGSDRCLCIYSTETLERINVFTGRDVGIIDEIRFIDNRLMLTSSTDGRVKLWDYRAGRHIQDLMDLSAAPRRMRIGRMFASETNFCCIIGEKRGLQANKVIMMDFFDAI